MNTSEIPATPATAPVRVITLTVALLRDCCLFRRGHGETSHMDDDEHRIPLTTFRYGRRRRRPTATAILVIALAWVIGMALAMNWL